VPRGGPDGGDGGRGGSISIKANRNLHTLIDFRYKKIYKAKSGEHGQGDGKHGKNSPNLEIKVPVGTLVKELGTEKALCDLVDDQQEYIVAKGGRGGRGNARFVTPENRSPRDWEVGIPGEDKTLELELKLLADIGLVGLPNAGKSTLLSVISAARPKIADYPFTTLQPNLGIVKYKDYNSFVVADIPGLIEGAHTGRGLGHQFLKHIERTRVLAFLIDITDENPEKTFNVLYKELSAFSKIIVQKPYIVVFTKSDIQNDDFKPITFKNAKIVLMISAVTGEGIEVLKDKFYLLSREEI
jgi:GTP-binding protein